MTDKDEIPETPFDDNDAPTDLPEEETQDETDDSAFTDEEDPTPPTVALKRDMVGKHGVEVSIPGDEDIDPAVPVKKGKFDKGSNFFKDAEKEQKALDAAMAEEEKITCLIGAAKVKALKTFGYKVVPIDDKKGKKK